MNNTSVRKLGLATFGWVLGKTQQISVYSFYECYRVVLLRQWLELCAGKVGETSSKKKFLLSSA